MSGSIENLWADFYEWPEKWERVPEDVVYGEGILEIFKLFVEELLLRHSPSTVKRHIDNLWLLGGELIRSINMDPEDREKTPMELLLDNVDENGGPSCRHLDTDEDFRSYDATCRKLFKFLRERRPNKFSWG